jgi:MinD superfamily P-loop ATPase
VSPIDQTLEIDEDSCWGCGYCVGICPEANTLWLENKKTGEVVWDNQGLAKSLRPVASKSSTAKTAEELVS